MTSWDSILETHSEMLRITLYDNGPFLRDQDSRLHRASLYERNLNTTYVSPRRVTSHFASAHRRCAQHDHHRLIKNSVEQQK